MQPSEVYFRMTCLMFMSIHRRGGVHAVSASGGDSVGVDVDVGVTVSHEPVSELVSNLHYKNTPIQIFLKILPAKGENLQLKN